MDQMVISYKSSMDKREQRSNIIPKIPIIRWLIFLILTGHLFVSMSKRQILLKLGLLV